MTAALILWSHALAALLFGALALSEWRHRAVSWPRLPFIAALALTALCALAVAGIDARDVGTRLAETVRDGAWLWFVIVLVRRKRPDNTLAWLYCVAGLSSLWALDLIIIATFYWQESWPESLVAFRGGVLVGGALLIAAGRQRGASGRPTLSRAAAWRVVGAFAVLFYAGVTAVIANLAEVAFGTHGRLAQTAIVFGATAALLTLASTPWLRAWTRVKVAKHLFSHRYDYRIEWQRFTATLGQPGAEALGVRVVRAVADLTDSPAGLLLVAEEGVLTHAAGWNWPDPPDLADTGLARHLAATGRIIALYGVIPEEEMACIPKALASDDRAWVLVPLLHGDALAGAIVLARPPVSRVLDWEDLDLLRVVGRQTASYLAEDRAHSALAEAARFGEFNRRFAFLLHDIKNVASQLTLVARNAERHADNPAFRADMVATLRESAERMTTLLARLGEHDATRPEPAQPVDLIVLANRLAAGRRAQHPVEIDTAGAVFAEAQPGRLEQVLGHLLQNAIEASGPGEAVRIEVRHANGRAAIDIVDRGGGMTLAFVRDQLFRPFASTKPGGFGIGAYEARQLVRSMGGEIAVNSRVGEGSRFTVLLPAAPALEHAA